MPRHRRLQGGARATDKAHDDAPAILRQNMALLETIAQKILEKEVIEGDDLKQMLEASELPDAVRA